MKFIKVDTIPERKAYDHKVRDMVEDFINGRDEIVKVDLSDGGYKNQMVAYTCLKGVVKRSKSPIKVIMRNGEVYLTRTF